MKKIIIIGSSGHAKVIVDIVECEGRYEIAGFLDESRVVGEQTLGYSILGKEECLPALIKSHELKGAIVAIGDNFLRSKIVNNVRKLAPNLPFVSAIHPSVSMGKDVMVGDGTVIMAGVVINSCSSIGQFCILNTNSSVDHDSVMGDFASLAPRVATGGNCRIGAYSAIGMGTNLIHGVEVGEHTVVGAGSTLLKNIGSFCVAYGNPAIKIKERIAGSKYL